MIRILDEQTVGQIAAGEIIERPLSVVKELVENAIDATATRIDVSVFNGGLDAIEVSDDGSGIAPDDLPLAVLRHATSKLAQAEDLESISSLGFRGEGLASIAAVSRVTVVSRRVSDEIGARIHAHAERASAVEAAPSPIGTTVLAEALFENVPVRREYMRSAAAEFSRISAWLSTFALAYPHVAFSLAHDDREVWTLPPTSDPQQRLSAVFGTVAQALIALDARGASDIDGTVSGFVSKPGNDRPDRRQQLLFVNGRLLRSTLLAGAWTAGYATFAMSGRHPFGVLALTLPPSHVDANVHPTKSDVRLRYGSQVFNAVRRAIASTLNAHAAGRLHSMVGTPAPSATNGEAFSSQSLFSALAGESIASGNGTAAESPDAENTTLRVLAQVDETFLLGTDGTAVVLVDQHAAHERIAYERIVRAAAMHAPSEPLLVPLTIEVSADESAVVERTMELLHEGGLEIERFGERTYRITATPAGYRARPFDLRGLLDDLSDEPKQRDVRERVWASLACHSVVRAGDRLDKREMEALLEGLRECANPMHCPHGRPTVVRLDPEALQKLFKRI